MVPLQRRSRQNMHNCSNTNTVRSPLELQAIKRQYPVKTKQNKKIQLVITFECRHARLLYILRKTCQAPDGHRTCDLLVSRESHMTKPRLHICFCSNPRHVCRLTSNSTARAIPTSDYKPLLSIYIYNDNRPFYDCQEESQQMLH